MYKYERLIPCIILYNLRENEDRLIARHFFLPFFTCYTYASSFKFLTQMNHALIKQHTYVYTPESYKTECYIYAQLG